VLSRPHGGIVDDADDRLRLAHARAWDPGCLGPPVEDATAIPIRILLGSFRLGAADPLHALVRAARDGDPAAVADVVQRARQAAAATWEDLDDAVVVPVPPHVPRVPHPLLLAIAAELADVRGWSSAADALRRDRPAPEGKTADARDLDPEVETLHWQPPPYGAVIVLLDDVVRTGATLRVGAEAIRRAGDRRRVVAIGLAAAVRG
jgi:hypothetical protein